MLHETCSNMKGKLNNILQSLEYCGLCLCNQEDELIELDSSFYMVDLGRSYNITLREISDKLFHEVPDIVASSYMCKECTKNILNIFNFIQKAKVSSQLISSYIEQINKLADNATENITTLSDTDNLILQLDKPVHQYDNIQIFGVKHEFNKDMTSLSEAVEDKDSTSEIILNYELDKQFICNKCNFKCSSKTNITKHIQYDHGIYFPEVQVPNHKCKQNFLQNKTKTEIYQAKAEEHNLQKNQSESNISNLTEDTKKIPNEIKKRKCDLCNEILSSGNKLYHHVKRIHVNTFTCQFCLEKFDKKHKLKKHMSLCEQSKLYKKCNKCSAVFKDLHTPLGKVRYQIHMDKHEGKIKILKDTEHFCTICHEYFDSYIDLRKHMPSHPKHLKHLCRFCKQEFLTRRYCLDHEDIHLYRDVTQCKVCSKRVKFKSLSSHMLVHAVKNGETLHLCETCGKNCTSQISLKYHMLTHADKISCNVCGKKFKPKSLSAHMAQHQEEHKYTVKSRFQCTQCDYKTVHSRWLESHVNRFHLNIKPYHCNICNANFAGQHLLNIHMLSHDNDKKYKCELCKRAFGRLLGLQLHVRRVHTGEKPYTCNICTDTFISSSILSRHKLRYHKGKTLLCPLCTSMFYSVSDIRTHLKNTHWKKDGKFDIKNVQGLTEKDLIMLQDRRKNIISSGN